MNFTSRLPSVNGQSDTAAILSAIQNMGQTVKHVEVRTGETSICVEFQPTQPPSTETVLPIIEAEPAVLSPQGSGIQSAIFAALADGPACPRKISRLTGYKLNSYLRGNLASMVRSGVLVKGADGYVRACQVFHQ